MKISCLLMVAAASVYQLNAAELMTINHVDCTPVVRAAADGAVCSTPTFQGSALATNYVCQTVTLSSRVKPIAAGHKTKKVKNDWATFGIVIGTDEANFWALNLVQYPTEMGLKHSFELSERYDDRWPAQYDDGIRAKYFRVHGGWEFGKEYLMEMKLWRDGVTGTVKDLSGKLLFEAHYPFPNSNNVVRAGVPGWRHGGLFRGEWRDTKFTAEGPMALGCIGKEIQQNESANKEFFHIVGTNGAWNIVSPEGKVIFLCGVDHVTYNGFTSWRDPRRYYKEWNDAHYPNHEAWYTETAQRLKTWGFNLLGAGCQPEMMQRGLYYTRYLSMIYPACTDLDDDSMWICPNEHRPCSAFPNVFSKEWENYCDWVARKQCSKARNERNLVGYFIDNELRWWGKTWGNGGTGLIDTILEKRTDHTARIALINFLNKEVPGGEKEFMKMPLEKQQPYRVKFMRIIAERLFRITTEAIRRYDKNHLILGVRFAGLDGGALDDVWEIAGKYCDVVTFNCYPWADLERGEVFESSNRNARRIVDLFTERAAVVGKPMMITEWSFPALDTGRPCFHGAGQRFQTQAERTVATEMFARTMLSLPCLIGYSYFMWVDEPAGGISEAFPEDSNYGLVSEQNKAYPIAAMFEKLHKEVPQLRTKAMRRATLKGNVYEYGDWRITLKEKPQVEWRGRKYGNINTMIMTTKGESKNWRDSERVTSFKQIGNIVEFICEKPNCFSTVCRLSPAGDDLRFEMCSLTNLSTEAMTVGQLFLRERASFEIASEVKEEKVPNLWHAPKEAVWIGTKGERFGATSTSPDAVSFNYYYNKDTKGYHPDAVFTLPGGAFHLAPGESKTFRNIWLNIYCK